MYGNLFKVSACNVKYYARAKYCIMPNGEKSLLKVEQMSRPVFKREGFEECDVDKELDYFEEKTLFSSEELENKEIKEYIEELNKKRARRRAQQNAFDKILCNSDLNTFVTFTIAPEDVLDRTRWEDCYKKIKVWLSNRVERKGLKYVMCAERHKNGGIHFHAIMNSEALKLWRAKNAKNGEYLERNGKPIYNIADWKIGFSTAVLIGETDEDREKVAKYIFKYISKCEMVGGRYLLLGGELKKPICEYSDNPYDFMKGKEEYLFHTSSEHCGVKYNAWFYK